jgi:hypothetical protein
MFLKWHKHQRAGIPVLMFTAPNVSLIHSARDILEEVNPDLLRDTVRLAVPLLRLPNPFVQGLERSDQLL